MKYAALSLLSLLFAPSAFSVTRCEYRAKVEAIRISLQAKLAFWASDIEAEIESSDQKQSTLEFAIKTSFSTLEEYYFLRTLVRLNPHTCEVLSSKITQNPYR